MKNLLARESLTSLQRDEMFALLTAHFDGVARNQFEHDLAQKNWVVEVRRDERLVGFTTLLVRDLRHEGRDLTAIYSGDTIVAPDAWNSPALARAWIAAVNLIRNTCAGQACHWLLLASGFRTYRFLPVFWREFYPRQGVPTPAPKQALLAALARSQYGACYDEPSGVVRFPSPQRLRGRLGDVPPGRERDPNVKFFLEKNPAHIMGDELVCLTEIADDNLTRAGWRMVRGGAEA
jgi:hypothetical protein